MEEPVITKEKPSTSSPLHPVPRIICHVCQKQFSQYTCPRCNSRYCSRHCYKSHNLRCTESFMRENVMEELRQVQSDDETKRKMMGILKMLHEEEETDSMQENDFADSSLPEEIIEKVLSGNEVYFEDLPPELKKRFQKAVASGEISKMIEPWEPWWLKPLARTFSLSEEGTQLIQPLSDPDYKISPPSEIPFGPEIPLTPVKKLISTDPSPLLSVHLVDIIYSYCFTLRLYNGDWRSDAPGSAMMALSISSILGQDGHPETVLEALFYSLEQTCSPVYRHMGGLQFGFSLLDDVVSLLSLGRSALICALSDLRKLVQIADKELKSDKSRRSNIRTKFKLAERKIYFIMCWVNEQQGDSWSSLAAIVRMEKLSAMDHKIGKRFVENENETKSRGKILIEEME